MTLLELLSLMKQRLWLVVLLPVLLSLVTAVCCFAFLPDVYTANVSLYVLTSKADSTVDNVDTQASQQLANDIAALVSSDLVLRNTADALGMQNLDDYEISVSSQTTNRVIFVDATGEDPRSVAAVANEIANQASKYATEIMKVDAVNIIDSAAVPVEPSGPNRLVYVAVAFLAGLFISIALIVFMDMLSTTVKSPEHAEELFGVPVIGKMPVLKKGE